MNKSDLLKTHPEHLRRLSDWRKWRAVYDGTDAIINGGYFKQHERESTENYERRCDEALCFGISRSIIDLFSQYLFLHPIERDFGRLVDDELFERFLNDCDYTGNGVDVRFREDSKWAAVYGHVGYLVDRPADVSANRAEDLANDRRPFVSRYFPSSILDWQFRRENGRMQLIYIKLRDHDGRFRLWWLDRWEVWRIDDETGNEVLDGSGANSLGVIPFVWLYSTPSPDRPGIGLSDMAELSRFDLSIMANVSQGDEIVTYAAFPMMRLPMRKAGEDQNDDTGPTAILEFDPEHPEGKPDWLEAKVKEPIDAIQSWIELKEQRAHKHAHASFIAGVGQSEAKAGIALQIEFTELGAALARKAKGLQDCEMAVYRLFARWQGQEFDGSVKYPAKFELDELQQTLENLLTARALVPSKAFAAEAAKRAVRAVMPDLDPDLQEQIGKECDAGASYNPPEGDQ